MSSKKENSKTEEENSRLDTLSSHTYKDRLSFVTKTNLYCGIRADQWPIVYHPLYNISFFGIEKLHPFDSSKWGRVHDKLIEKGMLSGDQFVLPNEASSDDLRVVHTGVYLNSLQCSCRVAKLVELAPVAFMPSFLIDKYLLTPFRFHTGGSILAARLALERNWAINLGGGFHHASRSHGGGFCVYADISLALQFLFLNRLISSALIVDLDAHQGNGHEHDFAGDNRVYIFDMFNYQIYPSDFVAKNAISRSVPLRSGTGDGEYLRQLSKNLGAALGEFPADFVLYNAGTDCLEGDSLGLLSLTANGVVKRDEIVFELSKQCHIPIVMFMSGGYMPNSHHVITQSILNLHNKKLITPPS